MTRVAQILGGPHDGMLVNVVGSRMQLPDSPTVPDYVETDHLPAYSVLKVALYDLQTDCDGQLFYIPTDHNWRIL